MQIILWQCCIQSAAQLQQCGCNSSITALCHRKVQNQQAFLSLYTQRAVLILSAGSYSSFKSKLDLYSGLCQLCLHAQPCTRGPGDYASVLACMLGAATSSQIHCLADRLGQ
jgi:hypothetical protein